MQPYTEGADAYKDGIYIDQNPYPTNTQQHNLWVMGWQGAQYDKENSHVVERR